jgi:hypothetical protein
MVWFQTKNPNLGKFWRASYWKMFIYFMAVWIFYGDLGYFITIWYILYSLGTFFRFWCHIPKKSGNPALRPNFHLIKNWKGFAGGQARIPQSSRVEVV